MSDFLRAKLIGTYSPGDWPAYGSDGTNNFFALADINGVRIFNANNPAALAEIAYLDVTGEGLSCGGLVMFSDTDFVYCAALMLGATNFVRIYKTDILGTVTIPAEIDPVVSDDFYMEDFGSNNQYLCLSGSILGASHVASIDMADRENPGPLVLSAPLSVTAHNTLSDPVGGVMVTNSTMPDSVILSLIAGVPTEMSTVTVTEYPQFYGIKNSVLYIGEYVIADAIWQLWGFDISDPATPVFLWKREII